MFVLLADGMRRAVCASWYAASREPRAASRNQQIPDRFGQGSEPHAHRQEQQNLGFFNRMRCFHYFRVYFYHLPSFRD